MSDHYHDYNKGSSRSTRDDSRKYEDRYRERDRRGSRSRSRSPQRPHSPPRSHRYSPEPRGRDRRPHDEDRPGGRLRNEVEYDNKRGKEWEGSDEEVPAAPPPPRISKITIGFSKPKAPIKMNLAGSSKPVVAKPTVASVFNADEDEDDEPEEMPAEAKMRMRNIGRETPTSAGPNSFGKTKQGFCDARKLVEKNLKAALENPDKPPSSSKFPQTIYRINGP